MGTLSAIMRNSGILLAYIVGASLDYSQIPFVFICLPLVFVVNFWFLPSTPQYLMRCGRFEVIHFSDLNVSFLVSETEFTGSEKISKILSRMFQ